MGILRNSVRNTTAWLLVLTAVSAGEDRPASRPLVNSEMEAWLEALSAREFASRQRATRKLLAAGTAAIPALETAASSLNSESRARAVSILEELALSTEPQIWKPAQAALRPRPRPRPPVSASLRGARLPPRAGYARPPPAALHRCCRN